MEVGSNTITLLQETAKCFICSKVGTKTFFAILDNPKELKYVTEKIMMQMSFYCNGGFFFTTGFFTTSGFGLSVSFG
jgi:phage antirepressor YoqD-like protein